MKMSHWRWSAGLMVMAMTLGCQDAQSQSPSGDIHPAKAAFADMAQWPATGIGDVVLRNFTPFRAVYERHYTDAKGQARQDRVVITAEEVAWDEEAAIMVSLTDTGSLEYDDTSARSQVRYFARDDLRLLLQVTPVVGTARDYTLVRAEPGQMFMTSVETATGETRHQSMPSAPPGFGAPGAWVFGSMDLREGMQVRLDPYFALSSSNILGGDPSRVVGQEQMDTPAGNHNAWVVERPLGMSSPRLMQTWVVDRPPYFLGKAPINADSGERSVGGSMRLIEFAAFP